MAKHWLIDAAAGPLDLDALRIELTTADLMADLEPGWQTDAAELPAEPAEVAA